MQSCRVFLMLFLSSLILAGAGTRDALLGKAAGARLQSSGTFNSLQETEDSAKITPQATASSLPLLQRFTFSSSPSYQCRSLALSGNTAAVGLMPVSVVVLVRNGTMWNLQAELNAPDAGTSEFGSSTAVSGDTILAGVPYLDNSRGAVYVFVRSGSTWTQQAKLTAPDGATDDLFGLSVALSGDTALVGSPGSLNQRGAVYVFTRSGVTWTLSEKLTASDTAGAGRSFLGESIALDGETALFSARYQDNLRGAAYAFVRTGGVWTQQQRLTASDGVAGDGFGGSVALSGNVGVIGTPAKSSVQGVVYVFAREGTTWTQQRILTGPNTGWIDSFGTAAAVTGDTIVVGAPNAQTSNLYSYGGAYVFTRTGTTWTQRKELVGIESANDQDFGSVVGATADTIMVGTQNVPAVVYIFNSGTGLRATIFASPDPVYAGQPLTYTVTVTNQGPDDTANTIMSLALPTGATTVSSTTTQGSVARVDDVATADLGTMAASSTATVLVSVLVPGLSADEVTLSATANVSSSATDPVPDDNTAQITVTAQRVTPTVTWWTPAITYGTPLGSAQLNATANVPGTFVYSPPAGTVLEVGLADLWVTFTPTDGSRYRTVKTLINVYVTKIDPILTWPTPSAITYGTALSAAQLNATANIPGMFTYHPPSGTVLDAGSQRLWTQFEPTDTSHYTWPQAAVTLVVNKATPTIAWTTPAAVAAGTAISSTQLNATASVPGTFVYSPPSGTVLNAGAQTLSVTFTPTDSTNYSTATASTLLQVTAASSGPGLTAVVDAAGYRLLPLAPSALFTLYGSGFAQSAATASAPLPTTLGSITLTITDSTGTQRSASLLYVSPTQVNFAVPEGVAVGSAKLTLTNGQGQTGTLSTQVAAVSPGIFSAASNGQGVAAATVLRLTANNTQSVSLASTCTTSGCTAVPIDLGASTDQVYLSLFGTGFRHRSSLDAVSVTIGGVAAEVNYAGDQLQFAGLDQLNVRIPSDLAGRGAVDVLVTVDGQAANTVGISIQ